MTHRECRNLKKRRLLGIPLMLGLVPALLISPLNARAVVIHSHGGNSGHAHLADAEELERWHHEHPDDPAPCTDPIGDDENARQTTTDAFLAVTDNEGFELVLQLPNSVLARLSSSAGQNVNSESPLPISPCLAGRDVGVTVATIPISWLLQPHDCRDAGVLAALLLTSNALLL